MVSQWRYAPRRHSKSQAGSFFFAEMKRTVSSLSPLGAFSDSMNVSNPYLYWSTSIRRTRSTVSCTAGIYSLHCGFKDRGLDRSGRLWSILRFRRSPITGCGHAARPLFPLLDSPARSFIQALRNKSISFSRVAGPILSRIAPALKSPGTPMAARTWDAATLPDEHAEPDDRAKPIRSRLIRAVSARSPGAANRLVLGNRSALRPNTTVGPPANPASSRSRKDRIRSQSSGMATLTDAAAAPNPAIPATFSVPARAPRSWPPPLSRGSARCKADDRLIRAPTPLGPPNLW